MLSGFLFLFWVGPLDREGFAATTSTQKARHFWHPRPFLDTPLPTKPPPQWHPFFDTPSPFFNNPHPGHPLCTRTHTDTPFVPPPLLPHTPLPPLFLTSATPFHHFAQRPSWWWMRWFLGDDVIFPRTFIGGHLGWWFQPVRNRTVAILLHESDQH